MGDRSAFGGVFGPGFSIEGLSFFTEAIGIYVYGRDHVTPRANVASGTPVVVAGRSMRHGGVRSLAP